MSKFKILWIDDDQDKIDLEKDRVIDSLEQKGYTADIVNVDSIKKDDISENAEIGSKLKARIYDLIFLDYRLKGLLGSDIISEMRRNNNMFSDIIFYSSDGDELKNKVKDSYNKGILDFVDDVHIAILDDGDWDDKIERAITKVISSWYKPSAFRGIVLDKTCKYENAVLGLIEKYCGCMSVDDACSFIQSVKKLSDQTNENLEKAKSHDELFDILSQQSHIFNWTYKFKALKCLIKKNIEKDTDSNILAMLQSVFKDRNDISHNNVEIQNGYIIAHLKDGDKKYDESYVLDFMKKIKLLDEWVDIYGF